MVVIIDQLINFYSNLFTIYFIKSLDILYLVDCVEATVK